MKQACAVMLLMVFCTTSTALAESLGDELKRHLKQQSGQLAYVVMDAHSGETLASQLPVQSVKPASIMKLITTYVALEKLGPEFKFTTKFVGERKGNVLEKLVFVGGGSPTFTMEDLWSMVRALRVRGIEKVEKVLIDDTLFVDAGERSGHRAYEAGTSAVSFNFNSVALHVCSAGKVGSKALLTPDPFELPIVVKGGIVTATRRGVYSIDEVGRSAEGLPSFLAGGKIGRERGCESVYRSVPDPVSYVGSTLIEFFESVGIDTPKKWEQGRRKPDHEVLYEHFSPPLSEIVSQVNHYSNNFMSDQLVYAIGGLQSVRWSFKEGLQTIKQVISKKFPNQPFRNYDGSGLSHQNRVSARLITEVIREAVTNPAFGPEFISSLPVAGRNGTLKDRHFKVSAGSLRAKTGTLNGVNSLAGLLTTKSKKALLFAVIANEVSSRDRARKTERELLERIFTW